MICRRKQQRSLMALVAGVLLFASDKAFTTDVPAGWKAECVGRYQVSVPSDVEVAMPTDKAFTEWVSEPYRFSDGSTAGKSRSINSGVILVSKTLDEREFRRFERSIRSSYNEIKVELQASEFEWERKRAKTYDSFLLNNSTDFATIGMAESQTVGISVYLYRSGRIIAYESTNYPDDQNARKAIAQFDAAFRPRPLYDLPKGEGVCIPYGFIADNGKPGRHVGVTMRLIDHPDVEIFFEDQTAPRPYKTGAKLADSERLNYMFWSLEARKTDGIEVLFPGYRSTTLAGYPGTASFVEIKRKDGTLDYGYAATVAGDYTAAADTPRLTLYVIRTASRTKGKPVSKNELKDMAYKIAASIKRRETIPAPGEKSAQ